MALAANAVSKLLVVFQLVAVYSEITATVNQRQEFRLPESLVPVHYDLQMQPVLDDVPGYTRFTAPGKVTITVNCTEATTSVILHVLDLTINQVATTVKNSDTGSDLGIASQTFDTENEFFVIELTETLEAGNQYDIFIDFIAPVSQTRLDGMYLDQYVDPATNETRYVATTLFAAISARRCFPSFDEPQLKAVFSVSLVRRESYHSLTNRHQISSAPIDGMPGWFLDSFAPSLPMSTYLVAMIVSDMTYEEAAMTKDAENTRIRVYAPYYFIDRGGGVYAANQTKTVLMQFENYYNSTFMLEKLDSVSLPRFFFSAMENWALITYNDRVLLYFPGETTEQERYRITSIVSHEVAHHYFGNLVTCEWWTWIWLNEGFATYVSHLGVSMTYPEFNPWDRFINDVYQVAMEYDASPATHPVANEPQSIAEIGAVYDDIAYEKGASLLRMMHSFLSEPVMQPAIRRYLDEKQFSTARQDELFEFVQVAAEEANNPPPVSVKTIMDTWTLVSGFPLIRVSRTSPTEVKFTQERFQTEPGDPTDETWWVPITAQVINSDKEYSFWIPSQSSEITFSIPDTENFVVNPASDGYYRTMYSSELLQNIQQIVKVDCEAPTSTFPSVTKAKLMDDYISFVKAGLLTVKIEEIVNGFTCLERESLLVWRTLLKFYVAELIDANEKRASDRIIQVKESLRAFQYAMNAALKRLESKNDGEAMMLRSELTFWTCFIDQEQEICQEYVEDKMTEWLSEESSSSPFIADFEETYFCIAASSNNAKYWERIYELMKTRVLSPKARLVSSLACTCDETLLERIAPEMQDVLQEYRSSSKKPSSISNNPVPFHLSLRLTLNNVDTSELLNTGKIIKTLSI